MRRECSFALLCGCLPPPRCFFGFGLKKRSPWLTPRATKWVILSPHKSKLMEKKPNSTDGYVVIVVRLPVKTLLRLGRWLLMMGSTYVLLHQ